MKIHMNRTVRCKLPRLVPLRHRNAVQLQRAVKQFVKGVAYKLTDTIVGVDPACDGSNAQPFPHPKYKMQGKKITAVTFNYDQPIIASPPSTPRDSDLSSLSSSSASSVSSDASLSDSSSVSAASSASASSMTHTGTTHRRTHRRGKVTRLIEQERIRLIIRG